MKPHNAVMTSIVLIASTAAFWTAYAGASLNARSVTVTAGKPTEFRYTFSTNTVPKGTVTFNVTNRGAIPHDFKICTKGGSANACAGTGTKLIGAGQSATLTYAFKTKGTYEYLCTVPGHAAAGMKGDLEVT